ncbi:serine/threonine-protein kinase BLUS1 [Selaginella moellendorffii]|nr:serine/threonine-protein kinase BLUS1 [Selaginella moellendorffii]|eukprot:XP_024518443.1 serine/threonine-protein kinase BLUS1 [Selaginella moellendorffii]
MEDKRQYPALASDYQLLEEVGQGVSATVYRAMCISFKEIVAIKSLDLEKCSSNLDEIRKEAKTMSLINHPNVVRAYCSFVVEHSLWVVMPYMAGGSCLHIMKAAYPDGFEEAVIATVLKDTLKALEYLHRHGHIHRDVKAGNILIDSNGAIKLGDFGVSACLFDTGDRQRSRNTFVGTPCWMAPEVMEQIHGYDFKADIWSFGITALELAHGHAPFSKYPPMKVLLMTLQNAPPGLDYERDRRFSKSFKEMIAMCLVKDPTKRPTAEKLLKHSFFKGAKSTEYLVRHVLEGLPPLWERVRTLKINDAARLAQKKIPYGEQEEQSQKEYKRGVSSWNFDVEDLKAQAALIQDDDDVYPEKNDENSSFFKESPEIVELPDHERAQSPPSKPESATDAADRSTARGRLIIPSKFNGKQGLAAGRKEPKHIGRFDVFEDDLEMESPGWHEGMKVKVDESESRREEKESRKIDEKDDKERRRLDGEEHRKSASGPLLPDRVLACFREEKERLSVRGIDDLVRTRSSFSGPLPCGFANGSPGPSRASAGSKEASEEKSKGTLVKGRFRVTSGDTGVVEDHSSNRRIASMQQFPTSSSQPVVANGVASIPVAAIMPQLQTLLHQNATQQDILMSLLSTVNPGEVPAAARMMFTNQRNFYRGDDMADPPTEKERELLQQLNDLQSRVGLLAEELQIVKLRNVQLERQLNAIFNKEEEERIRREEAAKDDG